MHLDQMTDLVIELILEAFGTPAPDWFGYGLGVFLENNIEQGNQQRDTGYVENSHQDIARNAKRYVDAVLAEKRK